MAEKRNAVREYVLDVLNSVHESTKWVWTVIMAGAVLQATFQFTDAITSAVRPPLEDGAGLKEIAGTLASESLIAVYFFIFLFTFSRFYVGGSRLLNNKYNEVPILIKKLAPYSPELRDAFKASIARIRRSAQVHDHAMTIVQSIIFVMLARTLREPALFALIYITLLSFNVVWLFLGTVIRGRRLTNSWSALVDDPELVKLMTSRRSATVWTLNNVTCAALMLYLMAAADYLSGNAGLLASLAVIMLMNCVIDVMLTAEAYFPTFYRLYDALLMKWDDETRQQNEPASRAADDDDAEGSRDAQIEPPRAISA